jgi:multicomponent Na+:H+ antiporter subunit E
LNAHSDAETRRNPKGEPQTRRGGEAQLGRTLALIVLLSLFWFILSGRVGVQYALFLVGTLGLVLWLNPERPFPGLDPTRGGGLRGLLLGFPYLIRYLVWLVWNVITANIEVARIILHPKMPVDPKLFRFRTELRKPFAQVVVANSITLTPGTVTVDLKDQEYLVHALSPDSASALVNAGLQNVVAAVFGESRESAPKLHTVDDADPGVFF